MKKQYLLLTFALAFLPLYSMENSQEEQLNTYISSNAFEENFLDDLNTERAVETIKGLNQCFASLSENNATKIQNIIRKLSDDQQKAIFQKLLEQQEWNVATSCAIWSDKTNGQWSALIEPLLNQNNTDALQALITLVPANNLLSLKMHLALSFQPLLDNKHWQEGAEWILNNINEKNKHSALMPYINQLITEKNFEALLVLRSCFAEGDFLYKHISLGITDKYPETNQSINYSDEVDQSVQNSNNNNDDNFRMENDNVSTQQNLYSDSNNNNEKIENKNRQTATIATSNGKIIYLDATKLRILKNESVTIANLLEDFQEKEHVTILLEITSDQFNEILSLLKTIHKNKLLSNKELKAIIIKQLHEKQSEKQEVTGKEGKQEKKKTTTTTVEEMITLFKTTDYLDVPLLTNWYAEILEKEFITPTELKQFIENPKYLSMFELPAQLSKTIATKISASCWAKIAGKLDIDFTHKILADHQTGVNVVAFSPNSHLFASASGDKTVCLYAIDDQNNAVLIKTLDDHISPIYSVAFSPDSRLLASASGDQTVCLYSIDDQNNAVLIKTLDDNKGFLNSVIFSPNSHLLASASGDSNTVCLYSIDDQNNAALIKTFDDHTSPIYSVAFSPDSHLLASASGDKTVCLYAIDDQNNAVLIKTLDDHHTSPIYSVVFSPDSRLLASASEDKTVCLYAIDDQNNAVLIKTFNKYKRDKAIAFSPDSRLLAAGYLNNTINIYDLNTLIFLPKNTQLEQTLFLTFCCNNQSIELYKYPHLQPIFDSLPEAIKNKLIEKELVKIF